MCVRVHMCVYVCICMCVCMHVCMYVCTCMYMCMYMCMHVRMHVRIHIHIHIHIAYQTQKYSPIHSIPFTSISDHPFHSIPSIPFSLQMMSQSRLELVYHIVQGPTYLTTTTYSVQHYLQPSCSSSLRDYDCNSLITMPRAVTEEGE